MTGIHRGRLAFALSLGILLALPAQAQEKPAGGALTGCVPALLPCRVYPLEGGDPPELDLDWLQPAGLPAAESDAMDGVPAPGQGALQQAAPDAPAATQTDGQPAMVKSGDAAGTGPQQTKRILGVMPNFRAVSAGAHPPPPTPKESFLLATQNSFDYSSFIFVEFTSALAEWTDTHTQLGQGMPGFGRYYWRGFADKTDGNYWVLFILPAVFHQDERYFTLGKGGFWKRCGYAASRVLITPNYQGHESFNISELLGRGIAQGISVAYYPGASQTAGAIASKYGYAILRDALTNVFREFWPDISAHVRHRHSVSPDSPAR
jgi:hypothetical protein